MVIADSQGDAIHAVVPQGFFHPFIDILHEKTVYKFHGFRVVKKFQVLRPVDVESAIVFTHLTTVRRRDDLVDSLPKWHYSLTPLSCLPAPTVDPGYFVDVLGTICAISDIKHFKIPNRRNVLIKRHVYLRDLVGHEVKIVLWGNCALRFKEDIIRAIGKTKPIAAIFVGATVQEYDGGRGLAGGAACSWYVDEDIVDINILLASLPDAFQPIFLAPVPHVVSLRTQVGENWPRKSVAQLATFDLFENQDSKFRCSVTISRMPSKQQWWYTGCNSCHRVAKACRSSYADPHTYTYTNHCCPSTDATLMYCLSVIASYQTGEAEFTLFGSVAEQVTNSHIC